MLAAPATRGGGEVANEGTLRVTSRCIPRYCSKATTCAKPLLATKASARESGITSSLHRLLRPAATRTAFRKRVMPRLVWMLKRSLKYGPP